ncbi:hypothetical protein BDY17DRAFT_103906 [Neohortaea acidophila]|uniref:Uncharacterized protein n=1 Tax=Neohortaea acidophila TaxID=245834 RepID=A0A6A6Q0E8_9PEZI|nr:uncharacterized protein BDY17DRAFT_103906 [Neohortaea acidophila]KAF2485459.1 hypothetical protein BDY17DRAFT_103906 [Neohortaea acidophila]
MIADRSYRSAPTRKPARPRISLTLIHLAPSFAILADSHTLHVSGHLSGARDHVAGPSDMNMPFIYMAAIGLRMCLSGVIFVNPPCPDRLAAGWLPMIESARLQASR